MQAQQAQDEELALDAEYVCVDVFQRPTFVLYCRRRRRVMQEFKEAEIPAATDGRAEAASAAEE